MIQRMLLTVSSLLILVLFSGCSWCETIVYVPEPYEVKVPVKCIVPDTKCVVSGRDSEVVAGLVKCIVDMKKAQEVCK